MSPKWPKHGHRSLERLSDCVQQGILAVQQEWLEFELHGNITGVVSLCSDDVVWLPPNQPALHGQDAVAGWLAALPAHRIRRIEIMNVRIYSSGKLAYKLADFTTWFEKAGQANDEFVTGSHVWVLRESSPEHWEVAVVAWSLWTHEHSLNRLEPCVGATGRGPNLEFRSR